VEEWKVNAAHYWLHQTACFEGPRQPFARKKFETITSRRFRAVFYALTFFGLDGFTIPTPAQVTQAVNGFPAGRQHPLKGSVTIKGQSSHACHCA